MDGVPLSMDGGTFGGRFLHGVHPPAAASSMDEDIHPWMRFIHRWCATPDRVPLIFLSFSLAYAELYMTIATVFRQFDLELFDTERSTVEFYRDYFNSFPKHGCDGVKVLVK